MPLYIALQTLSNLKLDGSVKTQQCKLIVSEIITTHNKPQRKYYLIANLSTLFEWSGREVKHHLFRSRYAYFT